MKSNRLKFWWATHKPIWLVLSNYKWWFITRPAIMAKKAVRFFTNKYWEAKKPIAFARLQRWRAIRMHRALFEAISKDYLPVLKSNLYSHNPILSRLSRIGGGALS